MISGLSDTEGAGFSSFELEAGTFSELAVEVEAG